MVVPDLEYKHPYIPITDKTESEMLSSIGAKSIEDLFSNVPKKFRLGSELNIPDTHSEFEVMKRIKELAGMNTPADNGRVFLGGGVSPHYIPSVVTELASRSEFLTSYTSYQPEISQGMLQTLFEYQSMLAELLDIEVVNSSMYDMATSLGEAARMSVRIKRRKSRFLVPGTMNPTHHSNLLTYTEPAGIEVEKIGFDQETGLLSIEDLEAKLDDQIAGVYIENPSYLGFLESQVDEISDIVHGVGALLVVGVNLVSLGIMRPPGDYGADIVISEGQSFGIPMSFGGPLLGVFGCKMDMKIVRQMPGRLVGMTRTEEEPYEQGFVLTLSPREQHIRREKATSNICSNQALMAVTAAIYMSALGPSGLEQLGESIALRSNYAARLLDEIEGVVAPAIGKNIFQDFVVRFENGLTAESVSAKLREHNIEGGHVLDENFPGLGESMLISVTEIHSKETIEEFVETIKEIVSEGGST